MEKVQVAFMQSLKTILALFTLVVAAFAADKNPRDIMNDSIANNQVQVCKYSILIRPIETVKTHLAL
jgi:hypothetical protein